MSTVHITIHSLCLVGTSRTTQPSLGSTTTPMTTTVICPLIEGMHLFTLIVIIIIDKYIVGMDNPQYINDAIFNGAPPSTSPSQLNPGSPGVDFIQPNASVIIPFASGVTPILATVSVPTTNTNVVQIIVVLTAPDGTVIFTGTSPSGTPTVSGFPVEPLPEGTTVTIIFVTKDGRPAENVTVSVYACYTPSTATTVVTSGTVPPSVSGTTPSLTISSTSGGTTQSTG